MTNEHPVLGILLLDTTFPRLPGDVGNESSYSFPVLIRRVAGATVQRVIYQSDPLLKSSFVEAAVTLEEEGVAAITSSCGFLSPLQKDVAASVNVPVFLSSLMQVPIIYEMTQRPVGIFTANAQKLTQLVLESAGINPGIPISVMGMEDVPAFQEPILNDSGNLDFEKIKEAILQKSDSLLKKEPKLGSFIFECHNLAPYALAVQNTTGKPVFDIIDFTNWVYNGVSKRVFSSGRN